MGSEEELLAISELLFNTGCIKAEIVPGTDVDEYYDMKKFKWQLKEYSEDKFQIKLNFKNPSYISVDKQDTMKI